MGGGSVFESHRPQEELATGNKHLCTTNRNAVSISAVESPCVSLYEMTAHGLPAASPDTEAGAAFWSDYAEAQPDAARTCPEYTVEHFGDSARMADELLRDVTHGGKRATSELVAAFAADGDELPRIGSHWIACDSTGAPRIILRSTEFRLGTFSSADESFAWDEGEDDRSLASWRSQHATYWTRTCAARGAVWSEDDEIVFERFRVVWPPALAD